MANPGILIDVHPRSCAAEKQRCSVWRMYRVTSLRNSSSCSTGSDGLAAQRFKNSRACEEVKSNFGTWIMYTFLNGGSFCVS